MTVNQETEEDMLERVIKDLVVIQEQTGELSDDQWDSITLEESDAVPNPQENN